MYLATANADISHTIGNIVFIMKEYISSLFPPEFFRYTHIGTRIAYKEFMLAENKIRKGLIKKRKPILVIRPRPIAFDDDIFLSRTPWTWPILGTTNNPSSSEYIRVFRDDEKDITLSYKLNRMRVQCPITMMFDTAIQQENVYLSLRNRFEEDRPYWEKRATEITVPHTFIDNISKLSGIPILDPVSKSPRKFLNYLMAHSNRYFTYKQNSGTMNDEFFVYYPETLELVFTDFDLSDADKKGQVTERADVNFTFTCEFNTIGMYQLSTESDDKTLRANTVSTIDMSTGTNITPMFTIDKLFTTEDKNGYKLFFTNIFDIDPDIPVKEPDILDLTPVFKDSDLKEILEYYDKNGLSYNTLFNFIIMKNNTRLNDNLNKGRLDYKVELDKQRILIFNKSKRSTYRILIYLNNLEIMKITNIINDLKNTYEDESQTNTNFVKENKDEVKES